MLIHTDFETNLKIDKRYRLAMQTLKISTTRLKMSLFQHERRHLRPKISATFLAWLLIFLMFALPIGIAYQ
jgi:Fe2+ transport system protein B